MSSPRRGRNEPITVQITAVRFTDERVYFALNDGREIGLPLKVKSLDWLRDSTPDQRTKWRILDDGWAVEWPDLDEGIEVEHLLWRHRW